MDPAQIITIICTTFITATVTSFIAVIKGNVKHYKTLQASQMVLIKDRIVQAHDYFCGRGCIGKYSLSTLEELFIMYKQLGGNSFIENLMIEIRKLEIN